MKKFIYTLAVACLVISISASCKKSSPVDCKSLTDKIVSTQATYVANQTTENCKAYKTALQNYANSSCASSLSATDKKDLQDTIDAMSCP